MSSACKPEYFLDTGGATYGALLFVHADDMLVILIFNSGEAGEKQALLLRLMD